MPIYSYRCEECGFAQEVLQKLSDPLLTDCPSCGKPALKKQLSAPSIASEGASGSASQGLPPCAFGGSCMGGPCG